VAFEQEVSLAPSERKDVTFEPDKFPQLTIANPKLWWPAQMGTPTLHELELAVDVDGKVVRSPQDELRHPGDQVGGGRQQEPRLLRQRQAHPHPGRRVVDGHDDAREPQRMEDELRYLLDMGLNTVRLEGKLETDQFFDYTDKHGILVMAGWCCCDFWEEWAKWKPADSRHLRRSPRATSSTGCAPHPSLSSG
jgi:exo-1,4-beta-D-glucosaminidase